MESEAIARVQEDAVSHAPLSMMYFAGPRRRWRLAGTLRTMMMGTKAPRVAVLLASLAAALATAFHLAKRASSGSSPQNGLPLNVGSGGSAVITPQGLTEYLPRPAGSAQTPDHADTADARTSPTTCVIRGLICLAAAGCCDGLHIRSL